MPSKRRAFIEAMIVWAIAILVAHLFYQFRSLSFVSNNGIAVTSFFFIVLPALALLLNHEPIDAFERGWDKFFASLRWWVVVSGVIFPLLFLFNHLFQRTPISIPWLHFYKPPFLYHPRASHALLLNMTLNNLVIAFGEEYLFRWYFLRRMRQVFEDQKTFLGVRMGKAFFITALVFAFSHSFITLQWWHPFIFFPALVFGWLREKTDALTAPVLFHTASNVFSIWVGMHYYR